MNTSIQLYTRTTAQWAASPDNAVVLKSGQPGIELLASGKYRIKIGNGANVWASLAYIEAEIMPSVVTQINDLIEHQFYKDNVRVASTANITNLDNTTTVIDGITLNDNDRVLVKDQLDATENGIYLSSTTGEWSRPSDFDEEADNISGATIRVTEGAENKLKQFVCNVLNPLTVGTDAITFFENTPSNYLNEIEIDITGLTVLDLTGFSHYDVINLSSGNTTENIEEITGYTSNKRLQLRSKATGMSPLAITYKDKTIPTTGNLHIDSAIGTTFVADSTASGFIELQRRDTDFYQTGGVQSYN